MENELISEKTEKKIISDLNKIIDENKTGKIKLGSYIRHDMGACMDFAMLYEASEELKAYIQQKRIEGIAIEVGEDYIEVLNAKK